MPHGAADQLAGRILRASGKGLDTVLAALQVENTPVDYLCLAGPVSGLGGKMRLVATNKGQGETSLEWGRLIAMSEDVKRRVDEMWAGLGIT